MLYQKPDCEILLHTGEPLRTISDPTAPLKPDETPRIPLD